MWIIKLATMSDNEARKHLGLKRKIFGGYSAEDISNARKEQLKKHHPDKVMGRGGSAADVAAATEKARLVSEAHEQLNRPKAKKGQKRNEPPKGNWNDSDYRNLNQKTIFEGIGRSAARGGMHKALNLGLSQANNENTDVKKRHTIKRTLMGHSVGNFVGGMGSFYHSSAKPIFAGNEGKYIDNKNRLRDASLIHHGSAIGGAALGYGYDHVMRKRQEKKDNIKHGLKKSASENESRHYNDHGYTNKMNPRKWRSNLKSKHHEVNIGNTIREKKAITPEEKASLKKQMKASGAKGALLAGGWAALPIMISGIPKSDGSAMQDMSLKHTGAKYHAARIALAATTGGAAGAWGGHKKWQSDQVLGTKRKGPR